MSADKITHRDGIWCADLHCGRCYSADTWRKSELAAALEENAALREQLAERDAENSKLRSALEIVHFKREPWQ